MYFTIHKRFGRGPLVDPSTSSTWKRIRRMTMLTFEFYDRYFVYILTFSSSVWPTSKVLVPLMYHHLRDPKEKQSISSLYLYFSVVGSLRLPVSAVFEAVFVGQDRFPGSFLAGSVCLLNPLVTRWGRSGGSCVDTGWGSLRSFPAHPSGLKGTQTSSRGLWGRATTVSSGVCLGPKVGTVRHYSEGGGDVVTSGTHLGPEGGVRPALLHGEGETPLQFPPDLLSTFSYFSFCLFVISFSHFIFRSRDLSSYFRCLDKQSFWLFPFWVDGLYSWLCLRWRYLGRP